LNIRLGHIERMLDRVSRKMDRGVDRDTRLVTRPGSKPYSIKKPRVEQVGGRAGGMDELD